MIIFQTFQGLENFQNIFQTFQGFVRTLVDTPNDVTATPHHHN